MSKTKIMLVGGGGRESAFACNLAQDSELYALISHANPTIIRCVKNTGGAYSIGNPSDPQTVLHFAQHHAVNYVFISADEPLAKGVVDILLAHNIKAIGGSQAATRIEWDKIHSIELMHKHCPTFTPFYRIVATSSELQDALADFSARRLHIVVKPQGLTGGKGVRVMPQHLPDYQAASDYATSLLAGGEKVLLVEKLHGLEFTIMGITDGTHLLMAPATYDYPYRFAGDKGAGTGGMGCFTAADGSLPFLQPQHLDDCRTIMQTIINSMREDGLQFNGVLNGGFFLTAAGIRFMEFNSRFGDPEALNIVPLLATPLSQLIKDLWHGTLSADTTRFQHKASVVKYLVAHEYPDPSPEAQTFTADEAAITAAGVEILYASCEAAEEGGGRGSYRTLKKSRVAALVMLSDDIADASATINKVIETHISGALEYRPDIGTPPAPL